MKKLLLKSSLVEDTEIPNDEEYYRKDAEKIVEICKSHGYDIDALTAYNAWWNFSDLMCADWIAWLEEDYLLRHLLDFCTVSEDKS